MLLTPAAACAFHFLKFPFRRLLLIIIINAFSCAAAGGDHPALHAVAPDLGLIDNFLSVLIPYVGLELRLVDLPREELPRGFSDRAGRGGHASTAPGRSQIFWYMSAAQQR